MGNTTTKQHQRCINGALLSEDGSSSDNDEGPSIFEPQAESARSARYMRRAQQRFDAPEVVETETTFFSFSENSLSTPGTYRPRILVCGCNGMGQSTHIAPALLHSMEHLTVHCLDLPALYGVTARTPEEACSQVTRLSLFIFYLLFYFRIFSTCHYTSRTNQMLQRGRRACQKW